MSIVTLQTGQQSPSGKKGLGQAGFGHKISSQTTLPLKKHKMPNYLGT